MTNDQEAQLWAAYKDANDMSAREQLILKYMAFSRGEAIKCSASSTDSMDDAISEAYVALIECVDRFDPSRGCKFATLAQHRIRGAIKDYARKLMIGPYAEFPIPVVPVPSLPYVEIAEGSSCSLEDLCEGTDTVQEKIEKEQDQKALGEVLRAMPLVERCFLLLRVFEKVPHKEVAHAMGFSLNRSLQLGTLVRRRLKALKAGNEWPWDALN